MPQNIIQAIQVHKTYESGELKVEALRGLDLTIPEGQMVAIMGPSGCGKTTLLNCLSGLDDLTSGHVLLEGKDIDQMKDDERTMHRAKTMGFVFQFYNLLPVLTALENVEMPLLLTGRAPREAREQALEMMAKVGLTGWEKHKPAELSGGQRQRVTIARALVNNPAIVWADEPTGDLDEETSLEIVNLFHRLNQEFNQTMVMVTHNPIVADRCQRLIRMRSGQIVEDKSLVSLDFHNHP